MIVLYSCLLWNSIIFSTVYTMKSASVVSGYYDNWSQSSRRISSVKTEGGGGGG